MNDFTKDELGTIFLEKRYIKKPIPIEAFRFGFDEQPEWSEHGGQGLIIKIIRPKDYKNT